ncbi:septal ring lytic transglycosylase RlpA family protein [Flavobacterium sp.]|uniref:septal ring lytic transglycosylase RlpA family protein n=1 Tax=Flavobacterium sp. TaxID=239 RepID=UPI0028BE1E75|nr:septal ring lytic transglycosylase RlpA family protein [Flavobacterium sp.]
MNKVIAPIFLLFLAVFFASSFTSDKIQVARAEVLTQVQDTIIPDSLALQPKFKPFKKAVHASYYHDKFNGRKTASGKRFDNSKLTAAHKKLPFGTKVRVTNPINKKSVVVTITDRGPFTRGREIDLSKKAFTDITHAKGRGFLNVDLDIVKEQ